MVIQQRRETSYNEQIELIKISVYLFVITICIFDLLY